MPVADRIWLGELIELMAPFGINERLVRTSCFRLIDEGWFSARREGRRSEYALTAAGRRRLELAYQRVYMPPVQDWDGRWTLVIAPRASEAGINRVELRRELEWQGFAQLTPGVMIHPVEKSDVLRELLGSRALGGPGHRPACRRAAGRRWRGPRVDVAVLESRRGRRSLSQLPGPLRDAPGTAGQGGADRTAGLP